MQGLELTFETLSKTRNEAAVDVLVAALSDSEPTTRRRALSALVSRNEARAPLQVLANWDKLQPGDLHPLRSKQSWMAATIDQALRGSGEQVLSAIAAAQSLSLATALPQLVLLAESSASTLIRQRATEATVAMAARLGVDARAERDQPSIRGPVQARLADSLRRFAMHRNEQLVDAFLLASTWCDGNLRQMISENQTPMDLICKRLMATTDVGVIDLLAGFVRRKNLPDRIGQIIGSRSDQAFRDTLLRYITAEPTGTVLRNLREIGIPECCRGGEEALDDIAVHYHAPLVHLYAAAKPDSIETLHLIAATVERRGPGCETAAAIGFSRCDVPSTDLWMRAAVPVADGDDAAIASDENARLLKRLIELLDHNDPGLVRAIRRVLGPLHAEEMLHRFQSLRPRSRRRLGRVVMMIDPNAIQRVRDALRHPVLQHRLEAIAMADALAIVDLLSDSFARIAREDHQEARTRAADAMSQASSELTLQLLQEMTNLPECPVRDAALRAIERRQTTSVG